MTWNAQEVNDEFDATKAPAWDRIPADAQQVIARWADNCAQLANDARVLFPDDDEQTTNAQQKIKEVFLLGFDAELDQNYNEERPSTDPNPQPVTGEDVNGGAANDGTDSNVAPEDQPPS